MGRKGKNVEGNFRKGMEFQKGGEKLKKFKEIQERGWSSKKGTEM